MMKSQIDAYLESKSNEFGTRVLEAIEFSSIIKEMAEIDERCALPDDIIQKLYDFVLVKQNGEVTFEAVLGLTFEILKERTSYVPKVSQQVEQFKPQSQQHQSLWNRISPIIEFISSDTMHQMKFLFEQCLEDTFREEQTSNENANMNNEFEPGVEIESIEEKISNLHSLDEAAKGDIEILFKIIQNDNFKVTPSGLAELMCLLEQFWFSTVQQQNSESISVEEEKQPIPQQSPNKQDAQKNNASGSSSKLAKASNASNTNSISQPVRYDYIENLSFGIDTLRDLKGQNKQYYDIVNEMFNNISLLGAKLESYEVIHDQQAKNIAKEQDNTMRAESKTAYVESEMRRLMEYKEQIEGQLDQLSLENEDLRNQNQQIQSDINENEKQRLRQTQLEVSCASLQRELSDARKSNEAQKILISQLQDESDHMFGLYKQSSAELEQLKQSNEDSKANSSYLSDEVKDRLKKEEEKLLKLKDEIKAANLKNRILTEEFHSVSSELTQKTEDYESLQLEFKQLQLQLQQAGSTPKRGNYPTSTSGRRSTTYALKPLSAGNQLGRPSLFGGRPSTTFGGRPSISFGGRPSNFGRLDAQLDAGRMSFNYSMRGTMIQDRLSQVDSRAGSITFDNGRQSSNTNINDGNVNFEKFWNQWEDNRKSRVSGLSSIVESNVDGKKKDSKGEESSSLVQFYANFNAFDENDFYARDFLGLRDNKKVKKLIESFSDLDNPKELRCFSDSVYRINNSNDRERRIMFATPYNIFILHTNSFKVVRRIQIDRITKISFVNKSAYLCVISIKQEYDYLIETYRRADFNMFLLQVIRERKLKPYEMDFTDEQMNIQLRGVKQKIQLNSMDEKTLLNRFQASFKSAYMVGFLEIQKHSWIKDFFSEPWKEYFFVLSNIGLISFKEPGDSKPLLYIPVSDALIVKDPVGLDRKQCVKISYQNSDKHYIFSCKSKADQDKWVDAFRKVIYNSVNMNAKRDQQTIKQFVSDPGNETIEEDPQEFDD